MTRDTRADGGLRLAQRGADDGGKSSFVEPPDARNFFCINL
jgi:hypothetical protein